MRVEDIARIAHETNRAYCVTLDDMSQKPWDDCPQWQKDSAINGVKFHRDNPDVTPEGSHENWFAEKKKAGWAYGPTKDPETKVHPCMVPYDELPEDQKIKDYLFRSIMIALLPFCDE